MDTAATLGKGVYLSGAPGRSNPSPWMLLPGAAQGTLALVQGIAADLPSDRPSNDNGPHKVVPQTRYPKLREQIQSASSLHSAFSPCVGLKGKASVSSAACVHDALLAAL